jgi:hypothetical protein
VNSTCTARFWQLFNALPINVQEVARKNHLIWAENPRHPSLRFKCLESNVWSVRVGDHYRALAEVHDQEVTWIWIGHHAEYDQILKGK